MFFYSNQKWFIRLLTPVHISWCMFIIRLFKVYKLQRENTKYDHGVMGIAEIRGAHTEVRHIHTCRGWDSVGYLSVTTHNGSGYLKESFKNTQVCLCHFFIHSRNKRVLSSYCMPNPALYGGHRDELDMVWVCLEQNNLSYPPVVVKMTDHCDRKFVKEFFQ